MKISKVILFEVPFYSDYEDVILPNKNVAYFQQDYMVSIIETLYSNYRNIELNLTEERSINFGLSISINVPYEYYNLRNYNYCFIATEGKYISFFCRPTAENNSIGNTTLNLEFDHFTNNIYYLYNGNYYREMFTNSRTMKMLRANQNFASGVGFDADKYFTNEGEPVVTIEDLQPMEGVDILYIRIQMVDLFVALLDEHGNVSYSEIRTGNSNNTSTPYTQNFNYGNSTYIFIPYKVYKKNTLIDITDRVTLYAEGTLGGWETTGLILGDGFKFTSTDIIKVDYTFYPPFGVIKGDSENEYIIQALRSTVTDTQYQPIGYYTTNTYGNYGVIGSTLVSRSRTTVHTHLISLEPSNLSAYVPYTSQELTQNGAIDDEMKLNTNHSLIGGNFFKYKLYSRNNVLPLPRLTIASDYNIRVVPREGGSYVFIDGTAAFNQSLTPLYTMKNDFSTFMVSPIGELLVRTSQYDVFMRNNANYFSASYNYKQFKNLLDGERAAASFISGAGAVVRGAAQTVAGASSTAVIPATAMVAGKTAIESTELMRMGATQMKYSVIDAKEAINTAIWDRKMHVAQIQDLQNSRDNLDIPNTDANCDIYFQDRILIVSEYYENPQSAYEGVLIEPATKAICDKVQFFGYNINMPYDILTRNGKCFDFVQTSKSDFQFAPPLSKRVLETIFNSGVRMWHADEIMEYNKSLNPNIKNFLLED